MEVNVLIPTHNPHADRLRRVLAGLRSQTLPSAQWSVIIVDNGSERAVDLAALSEILPAKAQVLREPRRGLTCARRTALGAARGELVVFVDDDNVLAPDYLAHVVELFGRHPHLGAAGGKVAGEFESPPAPWVAEFFDLLALRDLGEREEIAVTARPAGASRNTYPDCAPIGAGMALRRDAAQAWLDALDTDSAARPSDRTGRELSSGGDNDIVFTVLRAGWSVGYFPQLRLTHLIPTSRLRPAYLARLNRGIQRSWVQVLALHDACAWSPITRWTVPLRAARAFFRTRAWRSSAHWIRWQGHRGRFEGQASLARRPMTDRSVV